jgi:hypothetical protein
MATISEQVWARVEAAEWAEGAYVEASYRARARGDGAAASAFADRAMEAGQRAEVLYLAALRWERAMGRR